MSLEIMQVKRLSSSAILPTRGSPFAAGFDLSSAYAYVVPARGKALVKTDLAIAIPLNTYARIGRITFEQLIYVFTSFFKNILYYIFKCEYC